MLDTGTITGEIIIFSGILASIFLGGVIAAVSKIRGERSVSKWAFQPSAAVSANKQMVGTPIDALQQVQMQPIQVEPTVIAEPIFESSNIADNMELNNSIDALVTGIEEENTDERLLIRAKEQAAFLIGENVANLITATLEELPKEQAVVFGRYKEELNEIEMNGISYALSASEQLNLADGDLMLIKGQLLPNGEFRVLHWDDADNVEAGYGREEFIIQLVS